MDITYALHKLTMRGVLGDCSYALTIWMKCIFWLYMLMILYDVKFIAYGLFSSYLIIWGYGDSHEHCTCSLELGLLVRVLYALMICTLEHEMLIWLMWYCYCIWIWTCLIVVMIIGFYKLLNVHKGIANDLACF